MFGVGLPELILIMIIALLVVGPDRLPDLARTVAGYVVELKKAANSLKQSLNDEEEPRPWDRSPRDFTLPEGFSSAAGIVPEPEDEASEDVEPVDAAAVMNPEGDRTEPEDEAEGDER